MKKYNNNNMLDNDFFDKEFDEFLKKEIDKNYSPDDLVKARIKNKIKDNPKTRSKKRFKISKLMAASISGILIIGTIGAIKVVGSDFFTTTKEVHSGMLTVYEEKLNVDLNELQYTFSDSLKGKIYDSTGKAVDKITYANAQKGLFDSNGDKIAEIDEKNGTYTLEKDTNKNEEPDYMVTFSSLSEAQKHLSFRPKLPEGFELVKACLYKDDNGKLCSDCLDMTLKKDGDMLWIQERVAIKENAYETGAKKVEQVIIKGEPAILSDNTQIDWQHDGLFISIHSKSINYQGKSLVDLAATIK